MKIVEVLGAIGGGAFMGWLGRWLVTREERMRAENVALANVDLEKVRATGETDVTALRADHDTAKIALSMAERERDRYERQVLGHMECLAKVEHLQTRLDILEADHAGCPARIQHLESQLSMLTTSLINAGLLPALEEPAE